MKHLGVTASRRSKQPFGHRIAERLRAAMEQAGGQPDAPAVTISVGFAHSSAHPDLLGWTGRDRWVELIMREEAVEKLVQERGVATSPICSATISTKPPSALVELGRR